MAKKANKRALSQGQKWLAKARQSLSNCSRNYVVYEADGEAVAFGPSTVYSCTNWANSREPNWRTDETFIISQDMRDADERSAQDGERCSDCDPFSYGHPCVCRSKTIPKAWR